MDTTLQLKCLNCGAAIAFNANSQLFICEFCNSDFTEEEIKIANNIESDGTGAGENISAEDDFNMHTNLYTCSSCGAEIVADENTVATFCHYCHGNVTLTGRVNGVLQPELIIPFKIDRNTAETFFKTWCKKKWFLPKSFSSKGQLEKMAGLYVPFWLADCQIDAYADFECKKVHSYRSGDYRITHTKIFQANRSAKMEYLGIPADGSKKLDDSLMDSIEPFDYNEFLPFSMAYFSGFYADKYDVDKRGALERIKARTESAAVEMLRQSVVGYTSVRNTNKRMRVLGIKWHYTMLPVWFMTYKYSGKNYFFAINGQTGKVTGIPPVSKAKLVIMSLAFVIGSLILGFLAGGGAFA